MPVQVCLGEDDSNTLKIVRQSLRAVSILVLKCKNRRDFAKECIAAMQSCFLLKNGGQKLAGYGSTPEQRCKKDANEALLRLLLHQRGVMQKALDKMENIKALIDDVGSEEVIVLTFDAAPLKKFLKNEEWEQCIRRMAAEYQSTLEKIVKEMVDASKGFGASNPESSWKKDLSDADWPPVRHVAEQSISRLDGSNLRNLCNAFQKEPHQHCFISWASSGCFDKARKSVLQWQRFQISSLVYGA